MNSFSDSSRPIEAVTETWRTQSLNAVLWVSVVMALPAIWMVAVDWSTSFSQPMRIAGIVLYLLMAAIAMFRRVKTTWRAWAFFFVLYMLAAFQLYRAGMAGSGRTTLIIIPLYALLLAGFRSAWVALALDILLYGGFVGLLGWGPLAADIEVHENPTLPGYWILQGTLVLAGVMPLLILLGRFKLLHSQAVEAEYRASTQVRDEIVMRNTAYEALEQATREQHRLEEEITRTSEEERRRLGSELHDGLCQQLTAALLQCVAIENRQTSPPVHELRSLLEDSIGVAYEVARELCPLDLTADSLDLALERLAKQTREGGAWECEFQNEGDTSIDDDQMALHLYRIAQEAVTNATKHACPGRIGMNFNGTPTDLILQIEDNGCGMPEIQDQSDGMGLKLMAYRAGILGGTLDVECASSGGTRIVCRVPRKSDDNEGQHHQENDDHE